jgi:hypothetical protein
MFNGDTSITVPAPLSDIPVFVRAGAAVPTRQSVQHTGEAPIDPLTFLVFPPPGPQAGERHSAYYEDDGISFRYQDGEFFRRDVSQRWSGDTLMIVAGAATGSYRPPERALVFRITSPRGKPASVMVNGIGLPPGQPSKTGAKAEGWMYEPASATVVVRTRETHQALRLALAY